jgi:hypothetical protein
VTGDREALELRLQRSIERNAILIVAMRHLAADEHRRGPDHETARPWTVCPHASCARCRDAIDGFLPGRTTQTKDARSA